MALTKEQLKGRIKNLAKENNADPRLLMRLYMMERFIERASVSKYKDNFIIKGGILVTSLVGISLRSTLDIDSTIKNQSISENDAKRMIDDICKIDIGDGVSFEVKDSSTIMDEMEYPGIRFTLNVIMDGLITPIKIDISTGDVITPRAIEYQYNFLLEDRTATLLSYNLETILAEKLQAILNRELLNTRMRDFYDIYVLFSMYENTINVDVLKEAFYTTCKKRNSINLIKNSNLLINTISNSDVLENRWNEYQKKFAYVQGISYEDTINNIKILNSINGTTNVVPFIITILVNQPHQP